MVAQVLHCNDWHTAFAPLCSESRLRLGRLFAGTRSVLTIHNIGYQGVFASASIEDLSSAEELHASPGDLRAGR